MYGEKGHSGGTPLELPPLSFTASDILIAGAQRLARLLMDLAPRKPALPRRPNTAAYSSISPQMTTSLVGAKGELPDARACSGSLQSTLKCSETDWGAGGVVGVIQGAVEGKKNIICVVCCSVQTGARATSAREPRRRCCRRLRVDDTQMAGEADSQKRQTSLESRVGSVRMAFSTIHKVGYKNGDGKKKQKKTDLHSHVFQLVISCLADMFSEGVFFFPCLKVKSERSFN